MSPTLAEEIYGVAYRSHITALRWLRQTLEYLRGCSRRSSVCAIAEVRMTVLGLATAIASCREQIPPCIRWDIW